MSRLLLLLVAVLPVFSQTFSVGAKAGVPLTSAPYVVGQVADGNASATEQRFTVGPTAELHLPFRLSIEADALWRHSSISTVGGHFSFGNLTSGVNEWQIPLLLKHELKSGVVRPFVDAGPVFRYVSSGSAPAPSNQSTAGISIGGGVTFKALLLRISPEIRYTHWLARPFSTSYVAPFTSTSNQADLLVGVTF